jgi:hypothetical protein
VRFYSRPSEDPPTVVREEPLHPESRSRRRKKRKGLLARLKEMLDVRKEKRVRIGTQLVIFGLALMVFLVIVYGLTQGGIPGF